VSASARHAVRQALPGIAVWQVVHVEGAGSIRAAREAAEGSDALLLDSGRPAAVVPELGGTGRTHDWSVSADIVRRSSIPVLLAGGLNPENAAQAVAEVAPAGLDVCSGLRIEGALDPGLLERFVAAARS
jgi:phosphoribosylanthranilate isomerase